MTGQAGSTSLIHSHYRHYISSGLFMHSLRSVAPGSLRETGDDESGGVLPGRFSPQGISFCLLIWHNECLVLSPTSESHSAFSPLNLWA